MPEYAAATLFKGRSPLIPVLHVENADHAEPLLDALVGAGVTILEVTLRSVAGPEVIRRMRRMSSDAVIGAGTITKPEHFELVIDAGAAFGVSPALTPRLAEAAAKSGLPLLPGVCTPSEALFARECGFYEQKFFPADLMGGLGWIKHVYPLFSDVKFCPTGGINDANCREFLAQPNIFAVGGGYLAAKDLVDRADWAEIAARARASVAAAAAR